MTASTIDLGALIQAYRTGLRHMSGVELTHEAARNASLPRSPLADDMRHLVEAELNHRRTEQHAANDPQPAPELPPLPRPVDPPQIPDRGPRYVDTTGLAEMHADTVRLVEASRADRKALEQARVQARPVSGTAFEAVA